MRLCLNGRTGKVGRVLGPALEREGHLWVQAAAGPTWLDLDPSLPGGFPGEVKAVFADAHDAIPDELRHRVTFQVIGSVYLETAGFFPEASVEEIHVRVKSVKNRWRIIEPVLPPHVGQKRMINFVKEAWVKETEPAKRESLAALQSELRKAK